MRPVVGVTCDLWGEPGSEREGVSRAYTEAVWQAGGLPVLVTTETAAAVAELIARMDALLVTGGGDVAPERFGQAPHPRLGRVTRERDELELSLVAEAYRQDLPTLGVCRGIQVMAVALGGGLIQDLDSERSGAGERHDQHGKGPRDGPAHHVQLEATSQLARLVGADQVAVNSFHHQVVQEPIPPQLALAGRSDDGWVEALEAPGRRFFLGVQWHPEHLWRKDPAAAKLFTGLIEAASSR